MKYVEHVVGRHIAPCTNSLSCIQAAISGEHGQPPEHGTLLIAEQTVAPVERGPQRLLARWRRPIATHQQPNAVIEPFQDLRQRECWHASGSQFERERQAFQARADPGNGGCIGRSEGEVGWTACARSTNSRTAGKARRSAGARVASGSGLASEGTRQVASPPIRNCSRLVANSRTSGHPLSTRSARLAQASIRCSQLSNTRSSSRPVR